MFLRFATSAALQKRAEFFEPFVTGPSHKSVVQVRFCLFGLGQLASESLSLFLLNFLY